MTSVARAVTPVLILIALVGCAGAPPPASPPTSRALTLGLAFDPHPCVAGSNTVRAAVFVANGGNAVRYATPADGQLRVGLLRTDGSLSSAKVRWLDMPTQRQQVTLTSVTWNADIRFESPESGACAIRIEFQPSDAAADEGLGPALTTVMLSGPPRP